MPEIVYTSEYIYDKGKKKLIEKEYPYGDIVKFAFKGSFTTMGDKLLSNVLIPAGRQLKLLFLRVWTQTAGGAIFEIRQTAQLGDLGSSPPGGFDHPLVTTAIIDYPMLEAAGAEVLGSQPLDSPIHVLEGSIDFLIQAAIASPDYYGLAYWGVMQ